jgi:hypothetical protein
LALDPNPRTVPELGLSIIRNTLSFHYNLLFDRFGKNNLSLDFKMTIATFYINVVCFDVIIIRLKDIENKIREV